MRILVTGGCGFIGTNVCIEAVNRGHKVIAMDSFIRPKSEQNLKALKKLKVEILRGDVRSALDLQRSPIPDAIIHLAANPGIPWSIQWPKYDFEVNTIGTLNILEYARIMGEQFSKKIPVIFASTNKVYSDLINNIPCKQQKTRYVWTQPKDGWFEGVSEHGINEFFPIDGYGQNAHSPYGASKLAGDIYCQEYFLTYGVPTVVNRMSCIYGYHQKGVEDQGWIDHFVRKIAFGDGELTFYGLGKQVRDMLFGTDVARLYIDEVENIDKVKGEVFTIGGGVNNTLSLLEAVNFIEEISRRTAHIQIKPMRHADQRIYISDIRKIKNKLGWEPTVTPQEGIQKMYSAYLMSNDL